MQPMCPRDYPYHLYTVTFPFLSNSFPSTFIRYPPFRYDVTKTYPSILSSNQPHEVMPLTPMHTCSDFFPSRLSVLLLRHLLSTIMSRANKLFIRDVHKVDDLEERLAT